MQRAHDNAPAVPQKVLVQLHISNKAGMTPSLQQNDSCTVDSTKKITKAITTAAQKDQTFGAIQKIEQQQIKSANDSPPPHKHQQHESEKPQADSSKKDKLETMDDSGFFGLGGARSRSPSPKPATSAVTEKVFGFGSSFLSSASNMISTAVMDEPSITPPSYKTWSSASMPVSSQKGTGISQDMTKETKKPSNEKAEGNKIHESKIQSSKILSENVKDSAAVEKSSQQLPKTCPLCMTDIKEDLSNYSICTECKSIVCNLCGFSPMLQETEVSLSILPVGLYVC